MNDTNAPKRNLIILAEDTPAEADCYIPALQELGFEVRHYKNGQEAFDALEGLLNSNPGEYSRAILITDSDMSKIGGSDLINKLLLENEVPHRNLPILLWSKQLDKYAQESVLAIGAHHACEKPKPGKENDVIKEALEETLKNFEVQQQRRQKIAGGTFAARVQSYPGNGFRGI